MTHEKLESNDQNLPNEKNQIYNDEGESGWAEKFQDFMKYDKAKKNKSQERLRKTVSQMKR